jgi:hypothetical protein
LRENLHISTDADAKAKSPRGYILLLGVGGIFLLLLALVAGGVWWFAGGNNFSNQAQDIKNSTSFPDASMPSCEDKSAKDCVLSVNPFEKKLMTDYGQPLGQTQTLDNITLRLDQVYADNNYIQVVYTLFVPKDYFAFPPDATLTLENQPSLQSWGTTVAKGNDRAIAIIEGFDASTLSQTTGEIKLRFEIPKVILEKLPPTPLPLQTTPSPTPPKPANVLPTSTIAPANTVAAEVVGEPFSTQTSTGPFSFEFTAKLTPARILEPKQSVKAAAGTATLEKIVITPMTERLFISGLNREPDIRVELFAVDSAVPPGAAPDYQSFCGSDPDGLVSCNLEPGTLEKQKDWQIVLRRGVDVPLPTYPPCPECAPPALPPTPQFSPTPVVPSGPWIYKLKL